MNAKNTKEASEQYEESIRDRAKLRMELEETLDRFFMDLDYDSKHDIAEAACGSFALRDKFEQVVNSVILGLPLKEKINAAEGLEFKMPVRYAGVEIADDNKKDPLGRDPSER